MTVGGFWRSASFQVFQSHNIERLFRLGSFTAIFIGVRSVHACRVLGVFAQLCSGLRFHSFVGQRAEMRTIGKTTLSLELWKMIKDSQIL